MEAQTETVSLSSSELAVHQEQINKIMTPDGLQGYYRNLPDELKQITG